MRTAIRRNDTVKVIAGAAKGRIAKVLHVDRERGRVVLEGTNLRKRHVRPTQQNPKGGVVEVEAPIHISNVMLVCPKCSKPSRVRRRRLESGRSVRVCRKCGETIDKV